MKGSCLCGAVAFTVNAPLGPVTACHCGQCRKSTGHYAAAVPAKWADVDLIGEPRWFESSAGARRGFCATCGSHMFWEEYDGLVYISAGALDGPTGLSMDGHIFYGSKGDYYRANDGLPCFALGRSGAQVSP
ncbi:MAG: GFA family protein [Pseudomonadota bacterium]